MRSLLAVLFVSIIVDVVYPSPLYVAGPSISKRSLASGRWGLRPGKRSQDVPIYTDELGLDGNSPLYDALRQSHFVYVVRK
uniref:Neuropeptide-like protein 22 n=1 Tax=Ascaris suum TaxID=6253 RepID=U1LX22_ASCSU|nr:neuropeptide-like protein precursor 22 [Ascaris suum]